MFRPAALRLPPRQVIPIGRVANYQSRSPAATRHEMATEVEIAKRLAALRGERYVGDYDAEAGEQVTYFVPDDTLLSETAADLGIQSDQNLFGGVVPFAFVATKAITHPIAPDATEAPLGWSTVLAEKIRNVVHEGFTVFSKAAAHAAGVQLLARGPVRIKPVHRRGGSGQMVVADEAKLLAALEGLDAETSGLCGLVLETNLRNLETHSIGFANIGVLEIAYCGTQALTRNNKGAQVYGGSTLLAVRGDANALLQQELGSPERLALEQAVIYEAAARECFPGFLASRRNYDVLQGTDASGRWRSGVLEQSWRVGGASTAEIAAFEAFQADPALTTLRGSCVEAYGKDVVVPPDGSVFFTGFDEHVGYITKYAKIEQ